MSINEVQQHKLKRFINELSDMKGRNTELVSVLVPAGYELSKIIQHLQDEQGTASNIKSAGTRKNVISALEKMIQHLKVIGKTPPNGLACYSGNVSETEGKADFEVWSIEPPVPLKQRIYRCDKTFVLEPLEDMLAIREAYGLVVMDRREATLGLLKGKSIKVTSSATSMVPGKTRAGGQSAQRFERIREGAAKDFFKKVADMMKDEFLFLEGLKGIIVGGPGHTKYDFIERGYITDQVKQKIIAVKDVSYTDESGLEELLERSQDVLAQEEVAREKKIMSDFFTVLREDFSKIAYGYDQVKRAIGLGAVETLLLSEAVDNQVAEELEAAAEQFGSEVRIISTQTKEGVQLRDMGKIAAILRFPL